MLLMLTSLQILKVIYTNRTSLRSTLRHCSNDALLEVHDERMNVMKKKFGKISRLNEISVK